jgi:uncharacterized membrane protein YphA (DoxX/SURF4 family)
MSEAKQDKPCCDYSLTFAHLILRLWVGMRLFMAGIDKFRYGSGESTTWNMENFHRKSDQIATLMATNSFLPKSLCTLYANTIAYPLIIVGIWVALGIFTEFGLLAAGLVFLSLGFGLAALPDDSEVTANIGISIIIVGFALATARSKALSLDGLLRRK